MALKIQFPLPPSLNTIINANRSNKWSGATQKKAWTGKCAAVCKKTVRECPAVPVFMVCHFFISTRANDFDNVQSSKKFILDGMVDAGILKKDNLTWVLHIFDVIDIVGTKSKDKGVDVYVFTDYNEYNEFTQTMLNSSSNTARYSG